MKRSEEKGGAGSWRGWGGGSFGPSFFLSSCIRCAQGTARPVWGFGMHFENAAIHYDGDVKEGRRGGVSRPCVCVAFLLLFVVVVVCFVVLVLAPHTRTHTIQ